MNYENINIIANAIEGSDMFNQQNYVHECGAPSCIASNTVFLLDPGFIKFCHDENSEHFNGHKYLTTRDGVDVELNIKVEAGNLLGLVGYQPDHLFSGYPMGGLVVTNEHAAKVLRNIIDTGRVIWNIDEG